VIIGPDYAQVDGNTPPDFDAFEAAAKAAGSRVGFVILRGAYGTSPDPTVGRDWHAAKASGRQVGAFLFLRMVDSQPPEEQVHVLADNVGALRADDLPPIIDIEDTGFTAQAELAWIHRAWVKVREIFGVSPMLYTSERVWSEDLHSLPAGEMIDSPLWVAKPWPLEVHRPADLGRAQPAPLIPKPWGAGNAWLHQYQGDAYPCPGFSHTVDLSRFLLMRPGETGARVGWVQRRLGTTVNWAYDQTMLEAVKGFQSLHGLAADGVIGPQTFTRLCWTSLR